MSSPGEACCVPTFMNGRVPAGPGRAAGGAEAQPVRSPSAPRPAVLRNALRSMGISFENTTHARRINSLFSGAVTPYSQAAVNNVPPQPVQLALGSGQLQQDFMRVTMDRVPDPRWQFALVLRKNVTKIRPPEGLEAPDARQPVRSLGLLYREDVEADLEVFGVQCRFEVDPASWLETWLAFNGLSP